MIKKLFDQMIITNIKPKNEVVATGYLIQRDGEMFFVSGKDTICLTEHFPDTKTTAMELVENTIRYEHKKSEQEMN